jgi:formamidopyrimidine-DNA glycosylase
VPELPEVETVRRGLERQIQGLTINHVEVLRARAIASPGDPKSFCAALSACRVGQWRRRGKYLLAELETPAGQPAGQWGVHLRMTGQFLWISDGRPACTHTRVRIWGCRDGGESGELRFVDVRSFGQMWWIPPGIAEEQVMQGLTRLGPEPFSEEFSVSHLQQRLKGSQRPIKSALLDQSLVAGVGNIYADESLFRAGIPPQAPSGRLGVKQLTRLREALIDVLRVSIGAGGTTFSDFRDLSGTNGNYGGMAWVYRRGGQPCRICATPIARERLGGRSSHWCPHCQPD